MDKPCQIFNMDETGVPLDPAPTKVVTMKGIKHPTCVTTGNKAQITVVGCCSAGGNALPPMVIFDRKTLKPILSFGEFPGTHYGLSKKGWIDSELFDLWFNNLFLPHAPPVRPLLLIMDGHSTHYQPSVIRKAAEEHVILFCLPPHTTHLTQPLDKGCFGPLKMAWRQQCKDYLTRNPGKVVTRYEFSRLFRKAWERAMTMTNIISGFRCTGICPFDRSAIRPVQSSYNPTSLAERTGLKFIPLCSPARSDVGCCESFSEEDVRSYSHRFDHSLYDRSVRKYDPEVLRSTENDDGEDDISQRSLSPDFEDTPTQKLSFDDASHPLLQRQTTLAKTLAKIPKPKIKYPCLNDKKVGRVLTSADNLRIIEEKENEKQESIRKKEERRLDREKKRAEKQQALALRKERSTLKKKQKEALTPTLESKNSIKRLCVGALYADFTALLFPSILIISSFY